MSYTATAPQTTQRLAVVDALRGFALMAIIILHSIEHYNCFYQPQWQPQWLNTLDSHVVDVLWFFFAGKAYATFSLLFGFSFFIQMRNARQRGHDFRLRFAWRMLLLALFAQLHALFYNGDILLLYAFCGLILIPASSLSNRALVIIALVLLLQPVDWAHIITALCDPAYIDTNSRFAAYAAQAEQIAMHGDLWQTLADNIGNGQLYSNFWQVEAGRITQTPALFMLGMWLGRKHYFQHSLQSVMFWKRVIMAFVPLWVLFYVLNIVLPPICDNVTWLSHIGIALNMPANFCFMAILVAGFVLLWFKSRDGWRCQRVAIAMGRMSLTNYIVQSILGVTLFYNFGLGLYRYCGSTLSFAVALTVIVLLTLISRAWLSRHRQGPLEWLWKRLTWIRDKHVHKYEKSSCR
ncbi:MAG: DUF418 domain-containing protein [Paramuribaculum sp.]|nr:DUF418 domain-containing protein [Paramuribaculum sp.]